MNNFCKGESVGGVNVKTEEGKICKEGICGSFYIAVRVYGVFSR